MLFRSERDFSQTISAVRKARGLSQRTVAADLNISQALLSHYENGAREPGLPFICRACQYYAVTSDYLLGLTDEPDGGGKQGQILEELINELREAADKAEKTLKELK